MNNEPRREVLLALSLISGFVFLVLLALLYTNVVMSEGGHCTCFIPVSFIITLVASIGVFVGSFTYYFVGGRRFSSTQRAIQEVIEETLKLLPSDERKAMKVILEEQKLTQSELSSRTGFNRVKTSRIVSKLKERGVIEKKTYGNTNIIQLSGKLKKLFD